MERLQVRRAAAAYKEPLVLKPPDTFGQREMQEKKNKPHIYTEAAGT